MFIFIKKLLKLPNAGISPPDPFASEELAEDFASALSAFDDEFLAIRSSNAFSTSNAPQDLDLPHKHRWLTILVRELFVAFKRVPTRKR